MASQPSRKRWIVLAVASAANFLTILDLWVVNIAYPALQHDFTPATLSDVSWVLNIYAILLATLLITAGRLADSLGCRRCFFAGLIIFGVASVGCALAPILPVLIGFRALQAIGAAVLMPTSLSFALSAFEERGRGTAVGVWAAVGAVAASAGPVLGGLLITFSWRWIFLINIPLVAATILIGLRSLPADGERHTRRLDLLGAVLVFAATALVCTALVQISAWPAWGVWGAFVLAALLIVGCVMHVWHHSDPIIAPQLFRASRFRAGAIGVLTYYVGFAVILLGSTLLLTEAWNYTALGTALAIAPGPLVASILAPFSGRIAARVGHRTVILIGSLLFALAGAWPLITLTATANYAGVVLPSLLLWGMANGIIQPALFGTASAAPTSELSSASAVLTMARQLGSAFGVALLVAVLGDTTALTTADLRRGSMLVVASAVITFLTGLRQSARNGQGAEAQDADQHPADSKPTTQPAAAAADRQSQ
jgi:EmrB/QacA subfamily drug resistance transporter